jgi:hypothetical protein
MELASTTGASAGATEASQNLKVTVSVNVHGEAMSFSAVHRIFVRKMSPLTDLMQKHDFRVRGEAIVAPIADGGPHIVMVLGRQFSGESYFQAILACMSNGARVTDPVATVEEFAGTCSVPDDALPWLIEIPDPIDPSTLRLLGEESIQDYSIAMMATDAPVTRGIAEIFPWLKPGGHKPGNIYGLPVSSSPNGLPFRNRAFIQ